MSFLISMNPHLIQSQIRLGRIAARYASSGAFSASAVKESLLNNKHPKNNIPASIIEKVGKNLHRQPNHPLGIIKTRIETFCGEYATKHGFSPFRTFDDLSPVVDTRSCFDVLRVPPDHVSRQPSDTYYVSDNTVLRAHTSAHQTKFLSESVPSFLVSGDVYRRDTIDASHYPVFHQMEGVRIFSPSELPMTGGVEAKNKVIEAELKDLLSGLARELFGEDVVMRWNADYFPFTDPSFELEVLFNGEWLEVLGCGVIHKEVLANANRADAYGWAFGLGLERLAMVLFGIPDIRLFWTEDKRFLSQFKENDSKTKFVPYSKFPLCYKDVSFWLPDEQSIATATGAAAGAGPKFHSHDVYDVIRSTAGDLVEKVELFDEFTNKKTGKRSHAYRITYRHMDRSLTNAEVDEIQLNVRDTLVKKLGVSLR